MKEEINTPLTTTAEDLEASKEFLSKGNSYGGWNIRWDRDNKIAVEIRNVHVSIMNNGRVTFDCKITSHQTDEKYVRGNGRGCSIIVYYKNSSGTILAEWNVGIIPVNCDFDNKTFFKEGRVASDIYNEVSKCVPEISKHATYYHC